MDPDKCTNRAFASLKERYKKGSRFDVGVEVLKTENKGFGVRACRTFDEDQIILEYAGEIITEDECQRRMKEDYKDKEVCVLPIMSECLVSERNVADNH